MEKKLFQVQVATIYKNEDLAPDSLLYPLKSSLGEYFDEVPISNPVPPGLPIDIPVVVLNSKRKNINCNLSKIRADLFFNQLADNTSIDTQIQFIRSILEKYFSIVCTQKEIVRIGVVFNVFIVNNDPIKLIRSKYIQNGKLSHISELGVRFNRRSSFGRFTLNNLTDINSNAVFNQAGNEKSGCVVQVDTNNIPVSDRITDSEALSIFDDTVEYIISDDILGE